MGQKTDIIIMGNDDYITGEIKKMQFGLVTFKTDDMGTLSIKWTKIKHLISKHTFELHMHNGGLMYGSLDSSTVNGEILVKDSKNSYKITQINIVEITPIKSTFWDKLSGSVSLGFNYAKGTGTGQLNFAGTTTYRSKIWSVGADLNSIISYQNEEQTSRKQDFSINLQRTLPSNWIFGTMISFEQNTELGIDIRASIIPQGGYIFYSGTTSAIWVLGGLSFNSEKYIDTTDNTYNIDGYAQIQYQIFRYDSPKTVLTTYLNAYPGLTDWGRVRLNYNISLEWEIFNNLYWDLSYYYSSDNKPTNNAAPNDYGINTTFKFKFNQ